MKGIESTPAGRLMSAVFLGRDFYPYIIVAKQGGGKEQVLLRTVIQEAIETLPLSKDKMALKLRFGLSGEKPMSYPKVAAELNIKSDSQAQYIVKRALRRLRQSSRSKILSQFIVLSPEERWLEQQRLFRRDQYETGMSETIKQLTAEKAGLELRIKKLAGSVKTPLDEIPTEKLPTLSTIQADEAILEDAFMAAVQEGSYAPALASRVKNVLRRQQINRFSELVEEVKKSTFDKMPKFGTESKAFIQLILKTGEELIKKAPP